MNLRCRGANAVRSRDPPHPFRRTIDGQPPLFRRKLTNNAGIAWTRYSPLISDGASAFTITVLPGWSFLSGLTPLSLLEHATNTTNITAIPEAEGMCIWCVHRCVFTNIKVLTPFHRNHFATQLYMDHPPLRSRIHALHTLFSPRTFVYSHLLLQARLTVRFQRRSLLCCS